MSCCSPAAAGVLYDGPRARSTARPSFAADVTTLSFYPWPPADLRELALAHDVILVGGGNTANMLAVWRMHGFDRILREAWEPASSSRAGAPG